MMKAAEQLLPEDRRADLRRAGRLAWLSIAYLLSAMLFLSVTMAGSEAVKTELIGDGLSLVPPLLFLIGTRVAAWKPTKDHPYGFGRAVSAAYLGASLALLATGAYLFIDAGLKLITAQHPTFGGIDVMGVTVWQGWLALPALLWSGAPAALLGKAKTKPAERLNDKVLMADSRANSADWKSASAAMVGVIGIAFGVWWLDALAAMIISFDILSDGFKDVKAALADLMNRRPQTIKGQESDPLPAQLTDYLQAQQWISDAAVRLTEEGRFFGGEAFIVVRDERDLIKRIERTVHALKAIDWRLAEIVVSPVPRLPSSLANNRPDS